MPVKLVIFDVDGTLLRGDTACQTIARSLGKYERMCQLEIVNGRDQVIAARHEMAEWYMEAGEVAVKTCLDGLSWAPGVTEGMGLLRANGVQLGLASVTWSFIVDHVARRLGISSYIATELDFETGDVKHSWRESKAAFLHEFAASNGMTPGDAAAVGDTMGDYDMLQVAGLGVFVGPDRPDLPNVVHMPGADLRDVAGAILGQS